MVRQEKSSTPTRFVWNTNIAAAPLLAFGKLNMATVSLFWKTNMATASSVWNINMAAISWVWKTNMAAISLFWNTNMAAIISCKNTLLDMLTFTPYILQTTWYAEKSTVGLVHTFIYHQNDDKNKQTGVKRYPENP